MKVLVRGLGNIGTTLANLLVDHAAALGVAEVAVHTRRTHSFTEIDREILAERGVRVLAGPDAGAGSLGRADYVFDCREPGAPLAEREAYLTGHGAAGMKACAQGSETGFGPTYVVGINDAAAAGAPLVQVASCNTHALTTLLASLAGGDLGAIECADFVIVRRSEDLGSHSRLVSGTVVARHRDERAGTHHAADALRVFEAVHPAPLPRITSSDVTTPSQLLHTVRFALRFREPVRVATVRARIDDAPYLSRTWKFDANRVFELGRRYGVQGRLYAHAIVVDNNLLVRGHALEGWAFVPQEGNTLLTTLGAFMRQTGHARPDEVLGDLRAHLLRQVW